MEWNSATITWFKEPTPRQAAPHNVFAEVSGEWKGFPDAPGLYIVRYLKQDPPYVYGSTYVKCCCDGFAAWYEDSSGKIYEYEYVKYLGPLKLPEVK